VASEASDTAVRTCLSLELHSKEVPSVEINLNHIAANLSTLSHAQRCAQ